MCARKLRKTAAASAGFVTGFETGFVTGFEKGRGGRRAWGGVRGVRLCGGVSGRIQKKVVYLFALEKLPRQESVNCQNV